MRHVPYTGKSDDPAFRRERARKARAAQLTPEYYVAKVIAIAPQLTSDQVVRLRALLPPAPEAVPDDAA